MDVKIIDGNATPSSIALFFSDGVDSGIAQDPGNYTLVDPNVDTFKSPVLLSAVKATINYDQLHRAVMITLTATPLNLGDYILITAKDAGTTQGSVFGPNGATIALQVNGGGTTLKKEAAEVTSSVEDAVAYPLLTEQVSFPTFPGGGPVNGTRLSAPSGESVAAMVAKTTSEVLGWKTNPTDPKGFLGALTQSFDLTEVEGHVEATWNPRSYAVQTDMGGGITGAQASLYTRAKEALDSAMPLLNGLYPLDPDADPEYVKALREMARSQMTEIVKELGTVGGPSVLRINTYFQILLGQEGISFNPPTQPQFDPDKIKGTLGTLRDTYGVYFAGNPFSNSIEDEQDITNFRIISDYMTSLLQSWISNGQFFKLGMPNQPAFFGTQLVLLSRQFSVIGETVSEVRFALDSVFIGPSERQTLLLHFADHRLPSIFLEDMLREIEDFAADEGPRLLQDGGRISVANNILPVVRSYRQMVQHAHKPANIQNLPDGFRTVRVQRALDDLHDQLRELIKLAEPVTQQVPPPLEPTEFFISSISPDSVETGDSTSRIVIRGAGFRKGAKVTFTPSYGSGSAQSPQVVTDFHSEWVLVAKPLSSWNLGSYDVTVTNPDGTTTAPLRTGLVVLAKTPQSV